MLREKINSLMEEISNIRQDLSPRKKTFKEWFAKIIFNFSQISLLSESFYFQPLSSVNDTVSWTKRMRRRCCVFLESFKLMMNTKKRLNTLLFDAN